MPRSAATCARPRSMAARIALTASDQAGEHRLPDQEMADVELGDLRQRRDRLGAGVVETVAGVDFEPEACGQSRALADAPPFGVDAAALSPSNSA